MCATGPPKEVKPNRRKIKKILNAELFDDDWESRELFAFIMSVVTTIGLTK